MNALILVDIEEFLNQKKKVTYLNTSISEASKYNPDIIEQINLHMRNFTTNVVYSSTLYDEIIVYIKRLNNDKYIRSNGGIKEATFYQEARIDKSTWSDIKWGQITPKKKTLLKLVLALKLNQEEAEALLEMGKECFDPNDIQDQIIEAIIALQGHYDLSVQDIESILFEYQAMYANTKPFDCIYETPEMIAKRKESL